MTPKKLLRVSFLVESSALGDFVHQYADKVQALEIAAVVSVPHDKNKPGLTGARERGKKAREEILELLAQGPMNRTDLVAKFPNDPPKYIKQLTYNMISVGIITKTKTGALRLAVPNGAAKNGNGAPNAEH